MSQAINWNEYEWEEALPGFKRKVVHGENMTLVLAQLDPGAQAPVHSHHHEQFTTVLSGEGVFAVDGTEIPVSDGDTLHFPGGMEHGLTAGGEMLLLDIFSPKREDFPPGIRS